jgi:hypothetical protein
MKGMTAETIGFVTIALFGIVMLILFISGSLNDLVRNSFCYFYRRFGLGSSDTCKTKDDTPKEVMLRVESVDDLARSIAAYSILCWKNVVKSLKTRDTICYRLIIQDHPGNVSEFNVTYILETERGCETLENSIIANETGDIIDYPGNCGIDDNLGWEVYGNVIYDQELILIKYSDELKKVVVKG